MNFKRKSKRNYPQLDQESIRWLRENSSIFGPQQEREEVLAELRASPKIYAEFEALSEKLQEEFIEFCMGIRGMNVTYDPVFKKIMDPEEKPERLEEFLSLCLGQNVEILQVLPNESKRLTEDGSLLVMDILIRLASGDLVNVEIQRIGYLFPGPALRLLFQRLSHAPIFTGQGGKRKRSEPFSYHDIKKVYTIVLIQKSTSEFQKFPNEYLHHGKQTFSSGLELNMLQEYLLIPLDIFMENHQNISNKLEAWLYFIISDKAEDIKKVLEYCPEFAELYREVFQFRYRKGELISMYSDALRILDANTVQYMVEIQQEEIRKQAEELKEKSMALEQKDEEIARLKKLLADK